MGVKILVLIITLLKLTIQQTNTKDTAATAATAATNTDATRTVVDQFQAAALQISTVELSMQFTKWLGVQRRCYESDEILQFRREIFFQNYRDVIAHNSDTSQTYQKALNQFSDMSITEFEEKMLNARVFQNQTNTDIEITEEDEKARNDLLDQAEQNQCNIRQDDSQKPPTPTLETAVSADTPKRNLQFFWWWWWWFYPAFWDWRWYGAVSPVVNQGSCGSCWAFSVAHTLEGAYRISGHPLTAFSKQQQVDCCGPKGFGCYGCSGAWPIWSVSYLQVYGILKESQYPYVGYQTNCKVNAPTTGYYPKVKYYLPGTVFFVKIGVRRQPLSVCVHASTWGSYGGGIFNNCQSSTAYTNHAVTLIGYTPLYWIVKNSWGAGWGSSGYIYLLMGNTCGILNYPLIAY